jgi:hypothetical protein
VFPKRPIDAPPIFTPPAMHNSSSPRYAAGSLSDRMSSDVEALRLQPFPWCIGLILVFSHLVNLSHDFNSVFFLLQFRGLEQYSECDRPTE